MPADAASARQLVVFPLGGEHYAMPIESVSEIIRHVPPRPIPSRQPWLLGIISLRGKIVPILDLAARLGLPRGDGSEGGRIVILETGREPIGFAVAGVDRVVTVLATDIDPIPLGSSDPGVTGIVTLGDRIVLVLDADALFGEVAPAEPQRSAGGDDGV